MSEQDGIEAVMEAVRHWEEAVFSVNEKGQHPAVEMQAWAAVRAAIIAYGDSREAEGWHEGQNDGWNRAMEAEHPSEEDGQ